MNKSSRDLVQGMEEGAVIAEGHKAAARVHMGEVPDDRASRPDEDNPEWSEADFARARPASEVLPKFIGPAGTDELLRRRR